MQIADEPSLTGLEFPSLSRAESEEMGKEQDAHNRRTFRLAIIAIIVSAVVGLGNLGYQIYRDRSSRASTDTRFGKVETVLRLLTGAVAPQLQKAVDDSLSSALAHPADAKEKLVFAGDVIHQLRESTVSLPGDAVAKTSTQLNSLVDVQSDLPATWATVGEFITYRSQMIAGWGNVNLPLCTNKPAEGHVISGTPTSITHGPLEYHYCKIVLDSPAAMAALSPELGIADIVFDHCAVFYNGGPIVFIPVKVARDMPPHLVGDLYFKECLFVFSLSGVPPSKGQQFTKNLLAATSNTIELTSG